MITKMSTLKWNSENADGHEVDFDFFDSPRYPSARDSPHKGKACDTKCHSDVDSSSDDGSDRSDLQIHTNLPKHRKCKPVRKIEARLPSAPPTHITPSLSEDSSELSGDSSNRGKINSDKCGSSHSKALKQGSNRTKRKPIHYSSYRTKSVQSKPEQNSFSDSETSTSEKSDGSDVTDVSPLISPRPLHRSRLIETKKSDDDNSRKCPSNMWRSKRSLSDSGSDHLITKSDPLDMNLLMQAIVEMEQSKGGGRLKREQYKNKAGVASTHISRSGTRKNFSFDNDKVRSIDRENQRLMQNIIKHAKEANKLKKKRKTGESTVKPMCKHTRLTSSAINRRREQMRIEEDNQALLKRLQATKPSRETQKDKLLEEFTKSTCGYGSASSRPVKTKTRLKDDFEDFMSVPSHSSVSPIHGTRPYSAKAKLQSHTAMQRAASSKIRPSSAVASTAFSRQSASKPAWENGW